jgi:plastocyanin domain-containing protein
MPMATCNDIGEHAMRLMNSVFATALVGFLVATAFAQHHGSVDASNTSKSKALTKSRNKANQQVVEIAVTSQGFEPAEVKVKAGKPVKLVVTRKVERTCATDIVIKDYNISQHLPINKAVEVEFTPQKPGNIRYACAMDMISGAIIVER